MPLKLFSFFSGSGLLDLGFERAGFELQFVNEYSQDFLYAYQYSREQLNITPPTYGYHKTNIEDYSYTKRSELLDYMTQSSYGGDLIGFIGGPPCPDFSVGGKNKGSTGNNGKLSLAYINLIISAKPDFFIFENVKGLLSTEKHRNFYNELKYLLHLNGYCTSDRLLNALEFGVPQDRERILLFGIKSSLLPVNSSENNEILDFPWESNMIDSVKNIKNLDWPDVSIFRQDGKLTPPKKIFLECTVEYWFKQNNVYNHPNSQHHFQPRNGISRMLSVDEGDVSRKSFKRLHRWRYSPTAAYGNNEVHLHPYKARRLSASEVMAIQSLPPEFVLPDGMPLSAMFKTLGNGVPYQMAFNIALTIKDYLHDTTMKRSDFIGVHDRRSEKGCELTNTA